MSLPHWDPEVGGSRVNPGGLSPPSAPNGSLSRSPCLWEEREGLAVGNNLACALVVV